LRPSQLLLGRWNDGLREEIGDFPPQRIRRLDGGRVSIDDSIDEGDFASSEGKLTFHCLSYVLISLLVLASLQSSASAIERVVVVVIAVLMKTGWFRLDQRET